MVFAPTMVMPWRVGFGASILSACWGLSTPCAAQTFGNLPAAQVSLESNSVPRLPASAPRDTKRAWYGWKTLTLDAAAAGVALGGLAAFDGSEASSAVVGSLALSTYGFGAPVVHLLHDEPSRAIASLGLRVGLPVVALGMVVAGSDNECGPGQAEGEDAAACQAHERKLALVGVLSVVAASAIDATFLTWHAPAPPDRGLTLAPVIAWNGHRSATAGLSGSF
jgi:hypothetical protein